MRTEDEVYSNLKTIDSAVNALKTQIAVLESEYLSLTNSERRKEEYSRMCFRMKEAIDALSRLAGMETDTLEWNAI